LPLLLETPKDARWERFHHPFFILSEKCGICKLKERGFSRAVTCAWRGGQPLRELALPLNAEVPPVFAIEWERTGEQQ